MTRSLLRGMDGLPTSEPMPGESTVLARNGSNIAVASRSCGMGPTSSPVLRLTSTASQKCTSLQADSARARWSWWKMRQRSAPGFRLLYSLNSAEDLTGSTLAPPACSTRRLSSLSSSRTSATAPNFMRYLEGPSRSAGSRRSTLLRPSRRSVMSTWPWKSTEREEDCTKSCALNGPKKTSEPPRLETKSSGNRFPSRSTH
mmetsp:Transcript_35070/g.100171  ORF Transcript_35070/g.100171 Transcript_35070/m.100171 type:complete len:201 (+) Transcript_35070:1266-1868(+)